MIVSTARRPDGWPRVLLLASSFPAHERDSTARFMRQYAEALRLPGKILVPEPPCGQSLTAVGRLGVEAVRYWWPARMQRVAHGAGIPANLRSHPLAYLQLPPFLLRWARAAAVQAVEADVIVAHWAVPGGLVGMWAAHRTGRPLVIYLHSGGVHALAASPAGARMAEALAAASNTLVATSRFVGERFLERLRPEARAAARRRTVVLPLGIHFASGDGRRQPRTSVVFLGRLVPIKGLDVLLEAARGMAGVRLEIAGGGPLRASLERRARTLGLDARFLGPIGEAEKQALLERAAVVVVPSRILPGGRTEGAPVVLLEAMASGAPVLASAVGGIPEVVQGSGAGVLVNPDDPAALAKALQRLLADPGLRRALSRAGREAAMGFDWASLGPRHSEIVRHAAMRCSPTIGTA